MTREIIIIKETEKGVMMMNNEFCLGLRKDKLPKASIPAPIKS